MSVHAGEERNVCNIVVSAETPQSTTNPSQAAPHVQTSTLTPVSPLRLLQPLAQPFAPSIRYRPLAQIDLKCVYITYMYLHVCMRQYMRFLLIASAPNPISLRIF